MRSAHYTERELAKYLNVTVSHVKQLVWEDHKIRPAFGGEFLEFDLRPLCAISVRDPESGEMFAAGIEFFEGEAWTYVNLSGARRGFTAEVPCVLSLLGDPRSPDGTPQSAISVGPVRLEGFDAEVDVVPTIRVFKQTGDRVYEAVELESGENPPIYLDSVTTLLFPAEEVQRYLAEHGAPRARAATPTSEQRSALGRVLPEGVEASQLMVPNKITSPAKVHETFSMLKKLDRHIADGHARGDALEMVASEYQLAPRTVETRIGALRNKLKAVAPGH